MMTGFFAEHLEECNKYRIEFPSKEVTPDFLNCYVDGNGDVLFKKRTGYFSEFEFTGRILGFHLPKKCDGYSDHEEKEFPQKRLIEIIKKGHRQEGFDICLNDSFKPVDVYQMIVSEYEFFKDLKENAIDRGWYSVKEVKGLLHDKEVKMPEQLDNIINKISEYNVEKLFNIQRK